MSGRPRVCSGAEAVRKFKSVGWAVVRRVGSHVMLVKPDYLYTLSIPQHKELGIGLLRRLIKQSGLNIEQFDDL
ncbi:MAG: hypothetical protein A2V88_13505 [Elusimicrobia bacterium RBG_16_66_12]|nr:MAG: hypothetical protein A2V88_13505 [Elusimicrobia bacterium RBG_16_66_12]